MSRPPSPYDETSSPTSVRKKSAPSAGRQTRKTSSSKEDSTESVLGRDSKRPRDREDEFYDNMDAISRRLNIVEGMMDSFKSLSLKIEHSWEHMATKVDVSKAAHNNSLQLASVKEDLTKEIGARPTTSMLWIVIGALLMFGALPFLPEWWHQVASYLPGTQATNHQSAPLPTLAPPQPPKGK